MQESAYNQIQGLILNMELSPGEAVTEISISERLGIGRARVREALKKLEQEGLIITRNRRKRVHLLTITELEEIFDIKSRLETFVVSAAARQGSSKNHRILDSILEEMREAVEIEADTEEEEKNRLQAWLASDRKLHSYLYEMADNQKIEQILENLDLQWQRLRLGMYTLEGRMERSYREHKAVIEAIKAGNPEEASRNMRKHIEKVKGELVRLFRMFHYPVE